MVKLSGKKVIVTGGAGFIGSNLVESISRENEVVVIDNMLIGKERNLRRSMQTGNVKLFKVDTRDIKVVDFKPDIIFHLGMPSSTFMFREDNYRIAEVLEGAISVLRFAYRQGAKVILTSTSSVYNGNPIPHKESQVPRVTDFYTESKVFIERLAELYNKVYGIDTSVLRLFSVYGPHEEGKGSYANIISQFMWSMKKNEPPLIYGNGKQTRDFIYISDAVDALIAATKIKGFGLFNVGTGKNYSLNEIVRLLEEKMKTGIKPRYLRNEIPNYVNDTKADTSKSRLKLGFKAKIGIEEGMERLLKYYNENLWDGV